MTLFTPLCRNTVIHQYVLTHPSKMIAAINVSKCVCTHVKQKKSVVDPTKKAVAAETGT